MRVETKEKEGVSSEQNGRRTEENTESLQQEREREERKVQISVDANEGNRRKETL